MVKAKAAPNLQNRKSLNFQEKTERKSKMSKPSDVETVETVEGAEAAQMTTRKAKMTEDIPKRDRNRSSGAIHTHLVFRALSEWKTLLGLDSTFLTAVDLCNFNPPEPLRHESRRGQPGLRGESPGIAVQNREAVPAKGWAKCDVSLERGDDHNPKLRYERT